MKKLFNTVHIEKNIDAGILLIRIAVAALMLSHGVPKMISFFSSGPVQFPGVFGMSPELSLGLTVFSEVLCSVLIFIGLGTRFAAIPLLFTMLVAVLYIHGADPFIKKELGVHYSVAYLVLLITGSGRYSIDHLLSQKRLSAKYSLR